MTEHSKITPATAGDRPGKTLGKTLIERAEETFTLDGFKPAPVPAKLASAPNRRGRKAAVQLQPVQAPVAEAIAVAVPQAPAPVQSAAIAPAEPVERIDFSGEEIAIDRGRLREAGMVMPDGRNSALLEEFRIVKRQILLAAQVKTIANAQRVLVCSPLPGEGKTFCATNLALSIAAEKDTEVLLVDADFAKPSVLSALGIEDGQIGTGLGLMDALVDPDINVEDCVLPTDISGLFVLPAGARTETDSEFLSSSRTAVVLDRLTQGAPNRIVIFDSPPALAASPAAELAKHVGQALVIVRADQTGQSALEDALSLLSACPDIKLLLNAANFSPSGRRFGDYYGYGE